MKSLSDLLSEFEEFTNISKYGKCLELVLLFNNVQQINNFQKYLELHGYERTHHNQFKKLDIKIACHTFNEELGRYFVGRCLYGIVFMGNCLNEMSMEEVFWYRSRVRDTDQYSTIHLAYENDGSWEVEGL